MNILLSVILLIILYLYYLLINKDLSNPGVINLVIWLFASLGTIYFSNKWGSPLSIVTISVISVGIILFSCGVFFSNSLIKTNPNYNIKLLPKMPTFFFIIAFVFFIVAYTIISRDVLRVSFYYSNLSGKPFSSNLFVAIERARYMTTNYDYSFAKGTSHLLRANYALGIVFFTYFCQEIFYGKSSKIYKCLLLVFSSVSLFLTLLSTGRTELLGLISGYFVIYILYFSYKNIWTGVAKPSRLVRIILFYGFCSILLFLLVGNFVLNRLGNSAIDNLAKYIGSPISGLDYFIKNPNHFSPNCYFGENTFIAIYGTLKTLGFFPEKLSPFLPVIDFSGNRSNVYTAYYVFLKDFGYTATLLIQVLYGVLFGSFYHILRKRTFDPYLIMFYALLIYGMVIMFFQEAFLTLLTTHVSRIFFLIIWCLLIRLSSVLKLSR